MFLGVSKKKSAPTVPVSWSPWVNVIDDDSSRAGGVWTYHREPITTKVRLQSDMERLCVT
jgi:hypothetical protein